jgi:RNA polymerase sigma factor (sigma-70 family)
MTEVTCIGTLVQHAARGDELAWGDIVRSYTPLLTSVCRRYGLSRVDVDDVCGRVWLNLLTSIAELREPAALPGWLRTTANRECQSVLRRRGYESRLRFREVADSPVASDARLIDEEQRLAVCRAVDALVEPERRLIAMLFSDPPTPYAEISSTLDIPIGAIGPTRQRILKRLRKARVLRGYRPTR